MGSKKSKKIEKSKKLKINPMVGRPRPKPVSFHGNIYFLEHSSEYPILGCWIFADWQESGITPVVIARQQAENLLVYGVFLVDLYCLGVKDAYWRAEVSPKQFERELPHMCSGKPEKCDVGLAHELIYGSIEFARRYEFMPHADFRQASLVLDPPETHPRKHKVEFGKDGKPFFVSGPHDKPSAIISTLRRTAGDGNFDYLVGFGSPDEFLT